MQPTVPQFVYLIVQQSHCSRRCSCKKKNMSARLRSSKEGIAFRLGADIPYCNKLHNKRGLNTHLCRTLAWMGKRSWKKTLFTCGSIYSRCFQKKARAKLVTDFRAIAGARFFNKVFAYMILAQVQQSVKN